MLPKPCFPSRSGLLILVLLATVVEAVGHTEILTEGWRFHRGAAPEAAAQADFDDDAWRELSIPHDWAIEGPFTAEGDGGTGRLPWKGEGWYRRDFELPAAGAEQRVYFDFDGVMAFPKIYINGQLAGEWDYGYTSFRIDATPFVRWGERNVIAVHVDTRKWGSRWYPGAGIYRKVTMRIENPVHVAQWGIEVRTNGDELSGQAPDQAEVRTRIENHRGAPARLRVAHRLLDPDGHTVATSQSTLEVVAGGRSTHTQILPVNDPVRWDIDAPHRYTVVTQVLDLENGEPLLDETSTRFGFRTFAFTADDGFHLNGRRVQLFGANLHHDLGPLGAAFNRRAARRQLEILQELGLNALRTSHNPPAPEVLELCDEMGIVVWDEVFDKYAWTAGRADLEPPLEAFSQRHIEATVRRDFNHPSVVVWSTGNEVWSEESLQGINPERVRMMAEQVRALDRTRPVAQGCHIPGLVDGRNFAALDLTGWNYSRRYLNYRAQYPDRAIIYSESASTFSTRGYYDPELPGRSTDYAEHFQVSSYDLHAAPWSDVPDEEFRLMEEDSYVAGEFVWTGFDYLGEPTPFAEQARSSYFGIVDLCGFPKDRFYLYRSHWLPDEPAVHLLPHWNWPKRIGQNVPVFLYTNGDAAELFLNGRSLGLRRKGETPERLPNLAANGRATASSVAEGTTVDAGVDGAIDTLWHPAEGDSRASWQIDLGEVQTVAQLWIDTPAKENDYAYRVDASTDGKNWTQLVDHPTREVPRWAGPTRALHTVETGEWRYLRVTFTGAIRDAQPGLREFQAFAAVSDDDYYDVTYDYRLRWNDVPYEPGELRAVAYRGGEPIGEAVVETTGAPAALRLTADRPSAQADGEDLIFVTVEAVDAEGRPHPLADDLVRFAVEGPASIAAVGNGDPLSFEPFVSDRRHLFYGKALLILRPERGTGGSISVRATSPELETGTLMLETIASQQ